MATKKVRIYHKSRNYYLEYTGKFLLTRCRFKMSPISSHAKVLHKNLSAYCTLPGREEKRPYGRFFTSEFKSVEELKRYIEQQMNSHEFDAKVEDILNG